MQINIAGIAGTGFGCLDPDHPMVFTQRDLTSSEHLRANLRIRPGIHGNAHARLATAPSMISLIRLVSIVIVLSFKNIGSYDIKPVMVLFKLQNRIIVFDKF